MVKLQKWQWIVLSIPLIVIIGFLLTAASWQIHTWGINWVWGIFIVLFLGWRWLLVKWTNPLRQQMATLVKEANATLSEETEAVTGNLSLQQAETAFQTILQKAQQDPPIWEDLPKFWQRCQELVVAIAHIYHPEVNYPLLNIYIPQAYGLIRGTVDDVDRWMQQLSPALNQVTLAQAYQTYEIYRKWEPSARKLWQVWNWAQWLLNPVSAVARTASQTSSNQANQQLLANFSQLLREATLRNLCRQAIALYGGNTLPAAIFKTSQPSIAKAKTQTLQEIIEKGEPVAEITEKPVNLLLVGRTGAGKSSLINTLFETDLAEVDVLPSTDRLKSYHWQSNAGETLTLWDTPGYEQVNREDLRELVLDYAQNADLVLLVTPALDPALQMDVDFLEQITAEIADLTVIGVVTQVDRLRPIREWTPPYDWQQGDRPKEIAIREAVKYRLEALGDQCQAVLPLVTYEGDRSGWGVENLSLAIINELDPAKQQRIARFLKNREARIVAAAKIIDRYTFQMTTTQGLTALLKSPILQFISTLSTGSPTLAYILAEQIPVEQLPIVIGKLQMAYDLFGVFNDKKNLAQQFDLLALWSLLLNNEGSPDRNAWAFGHGLVEYWTQNLSIEQLEQRFNYYLDQAIEK